MTLWGIKVETLLGLSVLGAVHTRRTARSACRRPPQPGGRLAANVLLYPRGNGPLAAIANRINTWGIKKGILVRPYQAEEVLEILRRTGFQIGEAKVSGNCLNVLAVKPVAPPAA